MKNISKICIVCPAGCHLEIAVDAENHASVSGNRCPRGKRYAEQELSDPRRGVTAVVPADAEKRFCIPVKSTQAVPVKAIPDLLKHLYSMRVPLPVRAGCVILHDVPEVGIDIVATCSFKM